MSDPTTTVVRDLDAGIGGWELAFGPTLMGLLGYGLDELVGTTPWCTIAFAIGGLFAVVFKMVIAYTADMEQIEADGVWNRSSGTGTPATPEVSRPQATATRLEETQP